MQHAVSAALRPWYREPWPWILFGLPLLSVVVGIMFLITAIRTNDGVVTDDYYKKGKAINKELRRDMRACEMGLAAHLMLGTDQRTLRLITSSKVKLPLTIFLRMAHPSQEDFDQHVEMSQTVPNLYQGMLHPLPVRAHHWYLVLEDQTKQWRLQGKWNPTEAPQVSLSYPTLATAR